MPVECIQEAPVLPEAIFEEVSECREAEAEQSFEASSFSSGLVQQREQQQDSSYAVDSVCDNSLTEFKYLEQRASQRQSMELPQLMNLPMAQKAIQQVKQPSGMQQYMTFHQDQIQKQRSEITCDESAISAISSRQKPAAAKKHNFVGNGLASGNRSNASIEPKIIRHSVPAAPGQGDRSGRKSAQSGRLSSRNYMRVDQQRSVNVVNNFADKSHTHSNIDLSVENLDQPCSGKNEDESWQTFKPMTTCPNDRYSLKRHQEIFLESNISNNGADDHHSQMGQSETGQAQQA